MAERRAARENSTAEIRERKFREAVELDGAAREAGRALATEPGRGEGHGGAPAGSPGEALIDRSSLWGTVIHRAERIALRGSSTRGRASVFVVERLSPPVVRGRIVSLLSSLRQEVSLLLTTDNLVRWRL